MNRIEAIAEVTLGSGANAAASPTSAFGFITTFGKESFSAAVMPSGSAGLELGKAQRVMLRFLVPEAVAAVSPGVAFTFIEPPYRSGVGHIVELALEQQGAPRDGFAARELGR
ncbi:MULTISPECIES: hypothetical protein [Hydrocarboniphaga]|uniref:hypothetical protein n=1 Tax=Hydrocarboniphaga TaxID=243627 RepID=UPI0012F748D7|nr:MULTISPECIES: hypothetical protein [Hydrocarboniphaga]MDZ4077984.1 hypothetical protein [Hydrocarboniphaga sp.]